MGRISELPEELMQHILSFLPFEDATHAGILSKAWNKAFNTATLEFEETFFHVYSFRYDMDKKAVNKIEKLINIAEQNQQRRQKSISNIKIDINPYEIDIDSYYVSKVDSLLNRLIGYAVQSNAKELKLNIKMLGYKLPLSVFASTKSLTMLHLSECDLKLQHCTSLNLSSLKELMLQRVLADDQTIQNLINSCPTLEDLSIKACEGLRSLKISGLLKLKKVVLRIYSDKYFERVEIEAFQLEQFYHYGRGLSKINMSACKNLRTLHIFYADITDKLFHDLFSQFPLLENLGLTLCNMLESIKISSHCLKRVSLSNCRELVEVKIANPDLLSFTYHGKNVISFLSNALALLEVELSLFPLRIDPLRYVEFLRNFNNSKVVILKTSSYKGLIFTKVMRRTLLPPIYNVKHLTLEFWETIGAGELVKVLAGLLWISPRPEILSIKSGATGKLSIKFLYDEKLMDREETSYCCTSLPITCWRHSIKEVKIERKNFGGIEEKRVIKGFFLKNAKNLEKIDIITL